MQLGHALQVAEALEMQIPEAPGLRLDRADCISQVFVLRGVDAQAVEFAVGFDKDRTVILLRGAVETLCQFQEHTALSIHRQARRGLQ